MAARRNSNASKPARSRRRRSRFGRRVFLAGLLVLGLIAVTPAIVAISPLRDILLNWQMPPGWGITSQHAALSWTGNQSLSNIAVTGPDRKQLALVNSVTIEQPLWRLVLFRNHFGRIQVVRPVLLVESRPEGSNLEDFLTAYQEHTAHDPPTGRTVTTAISVVDGSVKGANTVTDDTWAIEQIEVSGQLSETTGLTLDGNAAIATTNNNHRGQAKFRLQPTDEGQQRFSLLAEQLPLKPLEHWLARVLPDSHLSGIGAIDAEARWSLDPQGELSLNTSGRIEGTNVAFSAAALGGDRLHTNRLSIPWKLSTAGKLVAVDQLAMEADWGQFSAAGSLDLAELLETFGLATLPKREFTVSGKVALPRLAEVLPQTLHIREGVRVDSGDVTFLANSRAGDNGFRWNAEVTIENLSGEDRGRNIRWQQPLVAQAQWMETPEGPALDRGSLASVFARANFATQKDRIQGDFTCNLNELTEQLGQFVDLEGWDSRGSTRGDFVLQTKGEHQFELDANLELNDLVVAKDDVPLWEEPRLKVDVHADGRAADLAPRVFSAGKLNLVGVQDQLVVTLLEEVDFAARGPWTMEFRGSGPVASWAARLRPWIAAIPAEADGDASLEGRLRLKGEEIYAHDLRGRINRLRVRDGTVVIDEPRVEIAGDFLWNASTHNLVSNRLEFIGSTLSFRSQDVKFDFANESPVVEGNLAFSTDLERLCAATGLIGHGKATWPRGVTTGSLKFMTDTETVQASFTLNGEQLQLVSRTDSADAGQSPPTTIWTEPRLQASGNATYNIAKDEATVDRLRIDGDTMQMNGTAQWTNLSSNGPLELRGTLEYDPAALAQLIAGYAGPEVQIQGDREVRFNAVGRVTSDVPDGPHWSQRWRASVASGWRSASLYGLPLGSGSLQASLNAGQLQIAPLDVAIGQGRLTANPRVVLDPVPQAVHLPAGPLITNVQISQEVSENMLMYVAPVLAGSTRVNGMFSLVLGDTRIPLDDPHQSQSAGRLAVHKLTIGPGPLIADLVTLVDRIEAIGNPERLLQRSPQSRAISMKDQQIEFQVTEGRVYHHNLEFTVENVPLRSKGSVGFDQTLALTIEIPVQDKWVSRQGPFRGLAGQTLQIPIGGTLQRPRVDDRAVANLTGQVLRGAAEQVIGDEINRQLERMFRPRER